MKNFNSFRENPIRVKALLGGLVFFFSLISCGSGACWGQLALSGNGDWTADIAITFSPELAGQGTEIQQKLLGVLQREVQPHRVAYRLTQRLERNADRTYRITLQGNEGLDQFKRVVFFAADPTIPLSDGPVALELSGKVKRGESIPITLESNPSTGYSWEFVNAAPLPAHQPRESLFRTKSNLLGAPSTQTIFLEGLEEGETSLEFIYRRPWQRDGHPKRRITIHAPEMAMVADLSNPNPPLMRPADTVASTPDEVINRGLKATEFVQQYLQYGSQIWIEFDTQKRDRFSRLLGYVYLADGRMLNEIILGAGLSEPLLIPPNLKYQQRFQEIAQLAQKDKSKPKADKSDPAVLR